MGKDRDWDAICGLGWHAMTTAGQPLYETLQREDEIALFALFPHRGNSYLVVGEMPQGAYKVESLVMVPAEPLREHEDRTFWVAKGEVRENDSPREQVDFIVDTGTPFLLAPPKDYKRFLHSVFPQAVFHRLCGLDKAAGNLIV